MSEALVLAITGLLAGLLSGMLGLGGGIVIVPALGIIFTWRHFPPQVLMQMSTATSLATIAITALFAIVLQNKRRAIQWDLIPWLLPGIMLGAAIGVGLGKTIQTDVLKALFAVFCCALSLRLLFPQWNILRALPQPTKAVLSGYSLLIGVLSGLLGIGGGLLLIPLLSRLTLSNGQISATSVTCVFPLALSGAVCAMFMVAPKGVVLPLQSIGFVYWPAALIMGVASVVSVPLGVFLGHNLPEALIKRLFGLILLWVAWHMFPFRW